MKEIITNECKGIVGIESYDVLKFMHVWEYGIRLMGTFFRWLISHHASRTTLCLFVADGVSIQSLRDSSSRMEERFHPTKPNLNGSLMTT